MIAKVALPDLPKNVNLNALTAAQVREIAEQIKAAAASGQTSGEQCGDGQSTPFTQRRS